MTIQRLAMLSVHTSPLAPLGSAKAGGMNVYVRELAQEFGRRGLGVDIYTRRVSPHWPAVDDSLGDNVRVVYISAGPKQPLEPQEIYSHLSQFAAGVIAYTTRQEVQYELVYSHYWLSGWVAYKLKEVWGTPFAHMYHTLGQMKNRIIPGYSAPAPDLRINVETEITNWADQLIVATPAERQQLLWLYRADRRKIAIVPPGVNTERFHPLPSGEAKIALGLKPDAQLLLFVGRLEPLKGVEAIFEALATIRAQRPDLFATIRLAVIGGFAGDSEMVRLRELSERLCLQEAVQFLGAKEQGLLPIYYTAASTVIMPSDYESFGMVALEAMASGTPVIASEVGGLAFLVRNNETGYLIPARDSSALAQRVIELLTAPEKRERLGRQAFELAQQYSWANIADQLLTLFERLAQRSPVPRFNPHKR